MKKIFLTFILVAAVASGFAQNYKKKIEKEFMSYVNLLVDMEFEKSMDYILPEFFNLVPKEQMVTLLEQTFNNPFVEIDLSSPNIIRIDDARKIDGKFYSLLVYTNQMNMKIAAEAGETEEEKKSRINLTKASFINTFGKDNVIYNEQTEFFEIQTEKDVYAISTDGEANWKFLTVEKKQMTILEKLLPEQLINEL